MAATLLLVAVTLLVPVSASVAQPDLDYTIGARDVLRITVFNEEALSSDYPVEADGAVAFPLIGRVDAGGLTLRQFEDALRARLADGYFRRPRLTVTVKEYRSQRVFIIGEVRQPGVYPLAVGMSLIEALATAGSTTALAAAEAAVIRGGRPSSEPTSPDESADAETIRIDLQALQTGDFAHNVVLRDGDTVIVPRAETIYVFGEVQQPGSYPIPADTTVMQALSLAGGATQFGALNRVRIVRVVDGERIEIRVELTDLVQPDDTVIVPERFF